MNKKKLKKKLCRKFKKLLVKHRKEMDLFIKSSNPKYWNKTYL